MFENAVSVTRLIESHGDLVAELAGLENLAHHLAGCPGPAALRSLTETIATLPGRLEGHMAVEEQDVYPRLVEPLGELEVRSMLTDHAQIRAWMKRLSQSCAQLDEERRSLDDVRWTLLVVIGLVNLHLRKEELAYMSVLARQVETDVS